MKEGEEVGEKDEELSLAEKKAKVENFDIKAFFEELECKDAINLLQKEDLFDSYLFFNIELKTIEEKLKDFKPKGKKIKLMAAVKKYRDLYEKNGEVSYVKAGLLNEPALPAAGPELNFAKSMTMKGTEKTAEIEM
jgi:hypothetical protein